MAAMLGYVRIHSDDHYCGTGAGRTLMSLWLMLIVVSASVQHCPDVSTDTYRWGWCSVDTLCSTASTHGQHTGQHAVIHSRQQHTYAAAAAHIVLRRSTTRRRTRRRQRRRRRHARRHARVYIHTRAC